MLRHLRPVKVVLTPLHLRVLFCDSVLALGFALALERESPSLHPIPESRVGIWQARVVCFLCAYGAAAQTTGFGFRTAPGFGSSAARLFPVGSADWRSRSPAKGGRSWLSNPSGFLPPSDQVTAARVLATPSWELFPLAENQVGKKYFQLRKCGFRRRTLAKPLGFHFWTPYPLFKDGGSLSTAYESHAEPHAPITAGLSVIRPEWT